MSIFALTLMTATVLTALVAGLLFAFACVVMPGLGTLPDHDFLRAFQVIDRVIQNQQPLFLIVWLGSALTVAAAAGLGLFGGPDLLGIPGPDGLPALDRGLLAGAALIFLAGVQAPTIAVNIPLNNQLQAAALDSLDAEAVGEARGVFEARWNRWNILRTALSVTTVVLLVLVLLRL